MDWPAGAAAARRLRLAGAVHTVCQAEGYGKLYDGASTMSQSKRHGYGKNLSCPLGCGFRYADPAAYPFSHCVAALHTAQGMERCYLSAFHRPSQVRGTARKREKAERAAREAFRFLYRKFRWRCSNQERIAGTQ